MSKIIPVLLSISLALPLAVDAAGGKNQKRNRNTSANCGLAQTLDQLPIENLSPRETRDLLFMREEEKLARDVYLGLFDEWNLRIFRNISKAERNHMASVLVVIDKYQLEDPAGNNAVGVFTNSDLQQLYEELFAEGIRSKINALQVGAAIEELDIFDLRRALEATNNNDLQVLYQNLLKGSSNHLRAFAKQLARNGATYSPVYLTPDEYQEILDSPQLKGVVDANGDVTCGSDKF